VDLPDEFRVALDLNGDDFVFCVEPEIFEVGNGSQLLDLLNDCNFYRNESDCFPATEEETTPANHIRARTVGASVAGSAGAVACTAAGGTGALLAYRRHHDVPVVDAAGTVDGEWEVIEDNAIFTASELESINNMPIEITDIPVDG